jgi:hypothetical protein
VHPAGEEAAGDGSPPSEQGTQPAGDCNHYAYPLLCVYLSIIQPYCSIINGATTSRHVCCSETWSWLPCLSGLLTFSLAEVQFHVGRSPSPMACTTQVERKFAQN